MPAIPLKSSHDAAEQAAREHCAALRIFGLLPPEQAQSSGVYGKSSRLAVSADARFAKALDRLQPLMHNVAHGRLGPGSLQG